MLSTLCSVERAEIISAIMPSSSLAVVLAASCFGSKVLTFQTGVGNLSRKEFQGADGIVISRMG